MGAKIGSVIDFLTSKISDECHPLGVQFVPIVTPGVYKILSAVAIDGLTLPILARVRGTSDFSHHAQEIINSDF